MPLPSPNYSDRSNTLWAGRPSDSADDFFRSLALPRGYQDQLIYFLLSELHKACVAAGVDPSKTRREEAADEVAIILKRISFTSSVKVNP